MEEALSFFRAQMNATDRWASACRWVKSNEALWRAWIPGPSVCLRGQGLFKLATEQFVEERDASWLDAGNLEGAPLAIVLSCRALPFYVNIPSPPSCDGVSGKGGEG